MAHIALPSGAYAKIREGESAQDTWMRVQREHPEEFITATPKPTAKPEGGFGAAFSAGLSRLGGEAALTAGKAGILDLAQAEEIYRRQQEKAEGIFKPTEAGWLESPFQKLKEIAGGSAAYMLAPAAAAGAAAFAPVTVPVIGAAGIAAGLTGLGQYTGSNLAAQMEEGKKGLAETSGLAAVGAAVPQAALDVFSFRMMPGIQRLFGAAGKEITEAQAKALAEQSLKQKIGDYARATGQSMGVEGVTEVMQDMLEKAQAGASLTDPKAREDYLENFIGGAALAGVLGPFGRGFERAGIQARGRELEAERLDKERKEALAARQAAAESEARAQFGTLFSDLGPVSPITGTPEAAQRRLAQIEQEAAVARQNKDMDTLLRLQRERTALEAQVGEQPTGMEQRQALEQRLAYYQAIEARLLEQAKDAPTAAEKRPVLEKLVEVQDQRRQAANALEQQEKQGVIPQLKTQAGLLRQEKATINALQKAEDSGDAAAQLKLTNRLADLQEQLGLFGQEAYTAQQQFEARQAELEAAARAKRPPLLLTDQRGATPIEMGFNPQLFPTPPRTPQDYLQGNLFGPEQRVAVPARTELTIPQIQSTVARLGEKTDLAPADQSLLARVANIAVPAPGVNIPEALQTRLTALQRVRQKIEQQLLQRFAPTLREAEAAPAAEPVKVAEAPVEGEKAVSIKAPKNFRNSVLEAPATKDMAPLSATDAAFELDVMLEEAQRGKLTPNDFNRSKIGQRLSADDRKALSAQIKNTPVATIRGLIDALAPATVEPAKPAEAAAETKAEPKATYRYIRDENGNFVPILVKPEKKAAPAKAAEAAPVEETAPVEEAAPEEEERLSDADILKLLRQQVKESPRVQRLSPSDQFEGDVTTRLLRKLRQEIALSPLVRRLDKLDRIERELNEQLRAVDRRAGTLLERLTGRDEQNVTVRQRISDWLSDTSRGVDNTVSRQRLEDALRGVEEAQRGETEALTKLKRRVASPEERELLGGKKTVLERVPTAVTTTAQQPDLFAGTEAARATEFETPRQMQALMASDELQKERQRQGKQALEQAQEAGPPTPADVRRSQKLLQPTVAYLQKQIGKLKTLVSRLSGRVDNYNTMLQVRTEEQDERVAAAKQQEAQVLAALHSSLLQQHQRYALAKLQLEDAKETYAGLDELQKRAEAAMDQALRLASEWAQAGVKTKERYTERLRADKAAFDVEFNKMLALRDQIAKVQIGEAVDPYISLLPEYNAAKKAAQAAFDAIYKTVRSRPDISPPDVWNVSSREIQQFLVQDAELTEMLVQQRRVVYNYEASVDEANKVLTDAIAAAKNDPVWSAFLKEAQDAVEAATAVSPQDQLTAPDKLRAAIRAANTQIRNLKEQQRAASAETTQASIRERRLTEAQKRTEAQEKTQAEIRAENERLEREAAATTRIAGLTPEQKEAVQAAQARIDGLLESKEKALAAKRAQQKNFRLSPKLKEAVAKGKKTKEQAIEEQREAELKKLEQQFDAQIKSAQDAARALREAAAPKASRREAEEEITEIAETQRQKRTGPLVRNVLTGRVSEPGKVPQKQRDLTEAKQAVETAETNRISTEFAERADAQHRSALIAYAKTKFDEDLSSLDTDAIEYRVLELEAEAEEFSSLRRAATEAEQEALAKDVAKGSVLDRIISHDYASRENTPLDDKTADAVNKGNLTQALTSLTKNGSTPFVRMVAQRLLPMVENTKLETASLEGKGGEYDAQTDTVTLNKDALTEEDLLHEAGHAATNTVASYEAEGGMTRRQFLKGAVTGLTALKLPNITENMSLAAQEKMFFDMLDSWRGWVRAANKIVPALKLDAYGSLDVADSNLSQFLQQREFSDVDDDAVAYMLENGGLKKLQASINASQRAIMAEAAKTSEGKAEARKEPFTPTKEQLDARTALEKLYAKMQGRPEFKDEYGNVSFKEFVSELLSNQQVRDKIDQTKGLLRRIYEGFLRMLGIEPTTLSDKAVEQAFAMFSPSTARVGKEERLASIARGVFPGTAANFSDKVPQSIADMVNRTIARNATLGDKVMANLTGLRMRTFIADQWAPVEALMKMGVAKGKVKEAQALQMQVYMRLFSNMQEYTNAALTNGVPELKKDAAGIRNIEGGDAKVNGRTIAQALSKASVLGNQQAIERTFTLWMASLRAKQDGIGLDKLNFKSPPTAKELADLDQMLKDNPTVKDAFEEARQLYRQYNRRLLNLQVQTDTMSKEVADELAQGDYIGFYRVGNNGVVELMLGGSRPVRVGNIIDQPYLKELVGGDQQILPFFASMTQNTSLLMSMALKNMQHKNTAYMFQDLGLGKIHSVPEGKQAPEGKLRFKQNGQDYWFNADEDAFGKMDVPFDLVMQGLQGVKTAVPALVKAMAIPANILRKSIRRMPLYTLRQTIRDPMHAWLTTGGNFVPVLSTWKALYKGMTNPTQTQIALKEAALISNNVYSGDSEGVTKMLRDLSAEPSKFSQTMMKLDEFAMQGDAATRAVLYDDFRKRGMSHIEALLNTAETMNFSRRGTSASLHWLAQMTPFFNAQIQGLDAAYRALRGNTTFEAKLNARNALLKRGAFMFGSTMAYAALMEDDETYKNATPEERYGNWFVPVPGTDFTLRVPIPFELGLIFKSIPEAIINVAYGDKKSSEAVKALAKQAYMSAPFDIPTAIKGPLEVAFNYNKYTAQPIETAREQALDADQRYRESTTELAKLLGKTGVLSPVQIDHLIRSYTSSAGIMLLSMANFALRPVSGRTDIEKPEMSLNEMPVVGAAFQPTTGRGMVNAAFEDVARYQRAAVTYKNLAASDPEAAQEYANKFSREIALASTGGSFRQQMGEFAAYKRAIASNPNLTGAQKREQIDAIKKQEIEFAQRLRKLAA